MTIPPEQNMSTLLFKPLYQKHKHAISTSFPILDIMVYGIKRRLNLVEELIALKMANPRIGAGIKNSLGNISYHIDEINKNIPYLLKNDRKFPAAHYQTFTNAANYRYSFLKRQLLETQGIMEAIIKNGRKVAMDFNRVYQDSDLAATHAFGDWLALIQEFHENVGYAFEIAATLCEPINTK